MSQASNLIEWSFIYKHDWDDDTFVSGTAPTTPAETLTGSTQSMTGIISLKPRKWHGAMITFDINYDGTPTDEVDISVYSSHDGERFDDTAIFVIRGDHDVDPQQMSLRIDGYPFLKVGFLQTGSTDSHEVSTVEYVLWR